MPLAESNTAAAITFDAAVHRALARRLSDTPYPRADADARHPAGASDRAAVDSAPEPAAR
ncbi:hypothetical protein H1235_14820 [Pseudoxanthomonas sp. NC8]|nr:hypothetical protein H1235_14820 [Pseudoxanthomonas sp. NC8]